MKYLRILLILSFTIILAACAGTGKGNASTHLKVTMTEFMFQPSDFVVPAGEEIQLEATNNGAIVHEFVIMKLGTKATLPFDDDDEENAYWKITLNPGESIPTSFMAPSEPGYYQVICGTPGHAEAGMTGKLTVAEPKP